MTAPAPTPAPLDREEVSAAGAAPGAAGSAAAPAPASGVALAPVPAAPPAERVVGGEVAVALLLRAGTLVAGLLLVAGLVAAAAAGRTLLPSGLSPGQLFRLEAEWPELLAGAGVLALCLTPIARVALAAGLFARAREKGAAGVAVGVLLLLLLGAAMGGAG